jgi:hypothetical protein
MRSYLRAAAAIAALTAAPVHAITGNFVKDFEHPYVGLVVFYDQSGEFMGRCSGSLLSPRVFLTAGHCVDGATSARVYFQQDAGANFDVDLDMDPITGYPEECLTDPCVTARKLHNFGYPAGLPNTKDIGLVILDHPIYLAEYGVLGAPGFLDGLATKRGLQDVTFTVSGYGLSYTNPARTESFRERLMVNSKLENLTSALNDGFNVQTTNSPGIGGGTCFGDSGGPVFYGPSATNTIVAVTSFGLSEWVCAGADFGYRTDRAEVISWILDRAPKNERNLIQIVQR